MLIVKVPLLGKPVFDDTVIFCEAIVIPSLSACVFPDPEQTNVEILQFRTIVYVPSPLL